MNKMTNVNVMALGNNTTSSPKKPEPQQLKSLTQVQYHGKN